MDLFSSLLSAPVVSSTSSLVLKLCSTLPIWSLICTLLEEEEGVVLRQATFWQTLLTSVPWAGLKVTQ